MWLIRLLITCLLILPLPAADLLTQDERNAVIAVVDAVVAAGFPDARGATLHRGVLKVAARFDSEHELPPLPANLSQSQETGSGSEMTYRFSFPGVHVHFADGSWLIALSHHFTPRAKDEVIPEADSVINPATLLAAAHQAKTFSAATDAAEWLKRVDPAQRQRASDIMDLLVPVSFFLKVRSDDWAPLLVLLHRAGWAEAPAISLIISDVRARSFWQLRAWSEPDLTFDPTGVYPRAKDEETAWNNAHPLLTAEPPATGLRRALFRWCRNQFMREAPPFTAAVTAACCRVSVDPQDPQGNLARIALSEAACLIPIDPPAGADLVTRLAAWGMDQGQPRMLVTGGNGGSSIRTSFSTAAYTPDPADLDALVVLLADQRPSRFRDFSGTRTLGDNAWRALTVLLKSDPRTLAGHPLNRTWTTAERTAAATAVQVWWKQHRGEFVLKPTPP